MCVHSLCDIVFHAVAHYEFDANLIRSGIIHERCERVPAIMGKMFHVELIHNCIEIRTNIGTVCVVIKFLITGKYQFEIIGHRYNIVEQYAVKTLNSRGKTITWKNPLVSDMETANHLADWLGDYYNAGIEYEYNTRGNPEIDANDIVYQENAYRPGLKVNIYRHIVNFSQSLSGKVIARRVSEK